MHTDRAPIHHSDRIWHKESLMGADRYIQSKIEMKKFTQVYRHIWTDGDR